MNPIDDAPIPFWQPHVGLRESALVLEVLCGDYLNDGEVTARFERELARLLNARHVVTTTSGTTALFAALLACGIKPGDEVLVPDVTFIATANAVAMAGATPVLVDVDPDALTICPDAARRAINPKTRGIIPVHISGRAADMDAIIGLAREHDLRVIEDAAEALGSRNADGRCLGTIGDAGCFSFSPNKIITTGQGGCVATNDDTTAARLRELKDQGRPSRGTGGDDVHASVGFNLKFTNLQAAVGLGQLEQYATRCQRLRQIYDSYVARLRSIEAVRICGFDRNELPLWTDVLIEGRDALDQHLRAIGICGRRFWHPLHTQAPYRRSDTDFPAATAAARRAFWLPSSFQLTDAQIDGICAAIQSFSCSEWIPRAEAA